MLDNMVTAVDHGFSYDGIVSVPKIGLEDAGQRPGLASWVDNIVVRLLLLLLTGTVIMDHRSWDSGLDTSDRHQSHTGNIWVIFFNMFVSQGRVDLRDA